MITLFYKIIKKILLPSKGKKITKLNRYFKGFEFSKVNKILFCSVVSSTFKELKNYFSKKTSNKDKLLFHSYDTNHPNELGHKLIALEILKKLNNMN